MSELYNIYCDESCHIESDHQKVMVLGAIWCPADKVKKISKRIREKKIRKQGGINVIAALKDGERSLFTRGE